MHSAIAKARFPGMNSAEENCVVCKVEEIKMVWVDPYLGERSRGWQQRKLQGPAMRRAVVTGNNEGMSGFQHMKDRRERSKS